MMKTVLFLLAVWCLLGLGLWLLPARPPVTAGSPARQAKPPVATVAAGVSSSPSAGLPVSALDVF